jgi:hypothetical protein
LYSRRFALPHPLIGTDHVAQLLQEVVKRTAINRAVGASAMKQFGEFSKLPRTQLISAYHVDAENIDVLQQSPHERRRILVLSQRVGKPQEVNRPDVEGF